MKIDKKLIKELVDYLKEFNLTELEYQEGQTKIKVLNKQVKAIDPFNNKYQKGKFTNSFCSYSSNLVL